MRLRFTVRAERDIEAIGDYIAQDNPARAVSFVEDLTSKCRALIDQPAAAPLRPNFGDGVRMALFGRHLIFYSFDDRELLIIRVIHGARNWPTDAD